MKNVKRTQGFTLIELLIVIAIIGILAAVLIPNLLNARKAANNSAASSLLRNAITAAEGSRANGTVVAAATDCADATVLNAALPDSVESCQVIQDSNSTYGITKSKSGAIFYVFNGSTVFKRGATVATTVAALSAINASN